MNIAHIALVRLSALGDIVNAVIVLQFIRERYPEVKIDWICEEVFAPLLDTHPLINAVHTVNLKKIKKERSFSQLKETYKKLRSLPKYDMIIDMQGLLKSALVARIVGKNIYGYDKSSAREGVASFFYAHTYTIDYALSVIKRNTALISQAMEFEITDAMIENKEKVLPSYDRPAFTCKEEYAVFVIGASWKSKIYPKEKVAEVCKELPYKVFIAWGSDAEKSDADYVAKHTDNAETTPRLDLKELCALIEHSSLVIGNDTGPTHMAWGYNIPSITLFGPTNERMIYPTKTNVAIHSPSHVDITKIDRNDFSIREIDPVMIVNKAKELLV